MECPREALFLDCGRPIAQLMRDSLGGTSTIGCRVRIAIVMVSSTILACSGRYDWSSTQLAVKRLLPAGSSVSRAVAVLDSLGFNHARSQPQNSIIYAIKREPSSNKLVSSSLRLVLIFDDNSRLVRDSSYEEFTGP